MIRPSLAVATFASLGLQQATKAKAESTTSAWPVQTFKTEPNFNPPVLDITKTGATAPGLLFFTPGHVGGGPSNPAIMTDEGELVWFGPAGADVTNFNMEEYNGKTYLHFFSGNLSLNDFKHGYGSVSILDHEYKQAYRVCLPDLGFVTPDNQRYPCYNDFHESQFYTPRGTIIVTAWNVTRHDLRPVGGGANELTLDSQFYELDIATGEILFRWSSLNHTDQLPITWSHYPLDPPNALGTGLEGTRQNVAWDYFHTNSIEALDDGYLVSSRHFWQAVKLNRQGDVEWILDGANLHGNFTLEKEGFFRWQHHMRMVPSNSSSYNQKQNTFTFHFQNNFNNEVSNGTFPTNSLEIELDIKAKTATVLRRLENPRNPLFSLQEGSYQALDDGHVLAGRGSVPVIEEYGSRNDIHYTARFGLTNVTHGYRVFKYNDWHATPYYPPKAVAVKAKTGQTTVYMSWNGATDVTRWEVLAGSQPHSLKSVGFVHKRGFETAFNIPAGTPAAYVSVRAYEKSKALNSSAVVKAT